MATSTGATLVTSGTNVGSGTAWTNPGNITLADSTNATLSGAAPGGSDSLMGTGLGFSIPSTATIVGIEMTISAFITVAPTQSIWLTKNGTTQAGSAKTPTFTTTPLQTVTFGSSSDLWGTTWTPTEINASTFGGQLAFAKLTAGGGFGGSCDFIKFNVYYIIPYTLTASTGLFTLTGENILFQLFRNYILTAATGFFSLTGNPINFRLTLQNQVTRLTQWLGIRKIK